MQLRHLLCLMMLFSPLAVFGQEERMEVSVSLGAKEAAPGEVFVVNVNFDVKPGFHTYPTKQKDPASSAFVTNLRVKNAKEAPVEVKGNIKEPEPKEKVENGMTLGIFEDLVELELPLVIKPGTTGTAKFTISLVTQVCDAMGCVPFSKTYDLEIKVKGDKTSGSNANQTGPPITTKPASKEDSKPSSSAPVASAPAKSTATTPVTTPENAPETLVSFTIKGIVFGFITLLTPCVFPMIPITVSFFLKQKKEGSEALVNATVYTLTIIASMTVIAYFFVQLFQQLTQQGITNLILGALFIYFALSLFGAYEITLPTFLTNWTSAGESKGGYIGTVFMAMTFTIISFSCVAPFLGGFAGATAAERPVLWNVSGALGFAVAFASPFFLLALFPSVLKTLPKSGNWLNTMKVVMGFLEVAAAIKFFRAAELRWKAGAPEYLTYDVCLALYIALCLLAGLYLLGLYLLPHDHGGEDRKIGVGRLIWALIFFSIGIYLFPGMFRGPDGEKLRPAGVIFSWVDAFLLPGADTKPLTLSFRGGGGEAAPAHKWVGFLDEALTQAKSKKQRIFIDFTGVT